jgi:prolyl oligopeptidase
MKLREYKELSYMNMPNHNYQSGVLYQIIVMIFGLLTYAVAQQPVAPVRDVTDEYYGIKVSDPYRYMEDLENPEVQEWIKGQAEYAQQVLGKIPHRDALLKRLEELDGGKSYRIFSIIRLKDGTVFYKKIKVGENISKLYVLYANNSAEKLLIDPEKIVSNDDQHFSIEAYTPSPNGEYVVYGLAKGGSEETVLHILNIETGQHLAETIDNIETAYNKSRWLPNGSGFFYCRRQKLPDDAPETDIYKKTEVYFHKLDTAVENDKIIMGYGLSELVVLDVIDFPSIYIPAKSQYAIAKIKHGDATDIAIYTAPINTLLRKYIPWVNVCNFNDKVTNYAVHGSNIYLQTAKDASYFKVVQTSLSRPDFSKAENVLEIENLVVESITTARDALYAEMIDGGFNRIARLEYGANKEPELLDIPNNAAGYIVSSNQQSDGILVYTNSWIKGSLIYKYDPRTSEFVDSGLMPIGEYDDLPGFTSSEVKVKSHDGVMVPLSIVHKSDIILDGNNPTLITGYGSYGFSYGVYFSPLRIAWLEQGGVYAVAHVRGGGEYGREWHLAGQKLNKPNTWKDFIACAEYLIEMGYTSNDLIAGQGGSAGGITIGRSITARPDLFAAAIIDVGSLDAIRFETTTNGVPNIPEFGTVTNEDGFKGLLEMSSYHHVKDGVYYPAVLLTHGINDPRVNPWMSAKMTARLQAATASDKPVIFRVDFDAGHGKGSTRNQYLEGLADKWAFLFWQFGVEIKSTMDIKKTGI